MRPIPNEFATVVDALRSLSLIILGSCHWWLTKRKSMFSQSGSPAILVDFISLSDEGPVSPYSLFIKEFEQWNSAFRVVWRRAKSSRSKSEFKRASLVRLYYLSAYLWMATGTPNYQVTRRFTRELEEIIHLSQGLMDLPGESILDTSFSLDTRIVLPLTVVGFAYRHRACRRRVIDIFAKMMRRREGLWDTCVSGKII
jgi:hypothetical protein